MRKQGYYEYDPVIYPRKLWVHIGKDLEELIDTEFDGCSPPEKEYGGVTYGEAVRKSDDGYGILVSFKKPKDMTMGVCAHEASHACDDIEEAIGMEHGGEANYQSSFKASSCGQFFTPSNICDLLARVSDGCSMPTDKVVRFNDCACGSGRTLLAAWNVCDKYNRNLFYAADIDSTSVYMCALNFLIHGMVGAVAKQDTLTQDWYFGFVVNACKVPFANNACCIQYFDKQDDFKRSLAGLEANARVWNSVEFRPGNKANEIENVEENDVEAPEEPAKPKERYVELDLFT